MIIASKIVDVVFRCQYIALDVSVLGESNSCKAPGGFSHRR